MATSSIVMLSNISMERLYLSQPPAWNDLQRLPFTANTFPTSQTTVSTENRTTQQILRTCYDKLLHHIYDMNSSLSNANSPFSQLYEQLKLTAEYCQLQISLNQDSIIIYSDQFYLQINCDPMTRLPSHIFFCFAHEQSNNEEHLSCPKMLKALHEKQYRLFRSHLHGYASLFTLIAPTMNNSRRIGFTAYNVLQQDLEHLAKTDLYGTLLEGFEPFSEGLPMRLRLNDQVLSNASIPSHLRIVLQSSANQSYLPLKSSIQIDEKTNQIHIEVSNPKINLLATGHFLLEVEESQPPLILLLTDAQEISHLTKINQFLSNAKPFNYLLNLLPKRKLFNQYQWYISHDQSAVSVRQIPFTNVEQLLKILNILRQQIHLRKMLDFYLNVDEETDAMDDDRSLNDYELFFELSFLSSTVLSITCAQASHLSTYLLQISQIDGNPILIRRQQQRRVSLTNEKNSLIKTLEQFIEDDESNTEEFSSVIETVRNYSREKSVTKPKSAEMTRPLLTPKLNRRLSCGPPAKPTWRSATTLRRPQPACFTLITREDHSEKIDDEQFTDESTHNTTNQSLTSDVFNQTHDEEEDDDDDEIFMSLSQQKSQQTNAEHAPLVPRPSLSFNPATLSRCTSASSTQSVSTPPIFGLTPSTPYPGGSNNQNGNIFFPLAKQVSVPDFNPVSPSMSMAPFDPSAFLPANPTSTISTLMPSAEANNKNHTKKKRRRSDVSADDIIQSINANSNDNRSLHIAKMASSAGNAAGSNGDPSNVKRGKKLTDKMAPSSQQQQQQGQQQLVRQKSAFKVTDSPTTGLLPQNQLNSPDETPGDFKPLKVVIKRVDGGNSSNDESQQAGGKPRKKTASQQSINANSGAIPSVGRKLNSSSGGSSPSISIKSEPFDMPQFNNDLGLNSMMNVNDAGQQTPTERPRPSSSLSNPSSSLASASSSSQPRSVPPSQPPIVLKINRSKVLSGQDQPSSVSTMLTSSASGSTTNNSGAGATTSASSQNTIPASVKDALQKRNRPVSSGNNTNKTPVTSPPLLAAKLTSPSSGNATNPIVAPTAIAPSFRIPRKSSSQEVAAKPKVEPGTVSNNPSPVMNKTPLLPTPGNNNNNNTTNATDLSRSMNKSPAPPNIRPSPPPAQIGSWQSPPTQQSNRFNANRARPSWTPAQGQGPRGRAPITSPNVAPASASPHSSFAPFAQQPRPILKKPSGNNDSSGADAFFMPSSDLAAFNEQRGGTNFSQTSASSSSAAMLSRTVSSPGMYDDNDDDSSPQAQLVIDTSSSTANNALLPYTIVPGSNSASTMDTYEPSHENHSINPSASSSSSQHYDEHSSILD